MPPRLLRALNSGVIGTVNLTFVLPSSRRIVSMLDGAPVTETMQVVTEFRGVLVTIR